MSEADIVWRNVTSSIKGETLDDQDQFIGYKVRRFVFEDIKITQEIPPRTETSNEGLTIPYRIRPERPKRSVRIENNSQSKNDNHKRGAPESTEEEIARCFHASSIGIVLILLTEVRL